VSEAAIAATQSAAFTSGVALEQLEARQKARLAEAILDKVPETQRVVLVLFELEGMSGEEIAELLEVSVGTVRSRLRLAREAFSREAKRLAVETARKEAV
jgi:RNA polymerase sigma-70 factor (ECF subfamily)